MNDFDRRDGTEKERAILVALKTGDLLISTVEEHLGELRMLAETAGAETVLQVIQDRGKKEPAFYIGKGKAEEIAELADLNDASIIIFDDDLTATQVRNLEKLIEKKIVDRSGLILDIFASHAKTNEAKTQVELAQLQYMLPRLTRAWTHLSKQYGGIGTKGPGETQIETDRRLIRTRISKLKEKLNKIERQQKTKNSNRENFLTASLVGYTNAGKSSLLNLLTGANVLAENKLFATLDSTTRAYEPEKGKKILITDTVGFIRKLPHHLVASFKSTLNVVRDADLILHVVDLSNRFFEDHLSVVQTTLKELGCEEKPTVIVFNKVDAVAEGDDVIEYVQNKFSNGIIVSAGRGINISELKEKLIAVYQDSFVEEVISINIARSKVISQIHSLAEVLSLEYHDNNAVIKVRTSKAKYNMLLKMISKGN